MVICFPKRKLLVLFCCIKGKRIAAQSAVMRLGVLPAGARCDRAENPAHSWLGYT